MTDTSAQADKAAVTAFINAIEDEEKREDARKLSRMMARLTGEAPRLDGTIIGFGSYHYRYESGHEGDSFLVGFSPRKAAFSIYLMGSYLPGQERTREALLRRLGKHRIGKACLYVKRLAEIDIEILEALIAMSVAALRERYGATASGK